MKLQTEHVASSAVTLMAKQDAEIRAPFGAGTPSCLRSVPPRPQCAESDEIRPVMSLV